MACIQCICCHANCITFAPPHIQVTYAVLISSMLRSTLISWELLVHGYELALHSFGYSKSSVCQGGFNYFTIKNITRIEIHFPQTMERPLQMMYHCCMIMGHSNRLKYLWYPHCWNVAVPGGLNACGFRTIQCLWSLHSHPVVVSLPNCP